MLHDNRAFSGYSKGIIGVQSYTQFMFTSVIILTIILIIIQVVFLSPERVLAINRLMSQLRTGSVYYGLLVWIDPRKKTVNIIILFIDSGKQYTLTSSQRNQANGRRVRDKMP